MSFLEVPGARLHYATSGTGPLMVMVPGANGEAGAFEGVTEHLAAHFTVVTYDRRGFSRSRLEGPQDYDRRLETDAADVRRLIVHLGGEPAILFGASSGGIVVLAVLIRHPSVVHTLLPFEPPAVKQLPDRQVLAARPRVAGDGQHVAANAAYWFEHELRQYPAVELDVDALRAHADRIVLVGGGNRAAVPRST
jgi:acetyltransferase/esterase